MASPFDVFTRTTFAVRRVTSPTAGNFDSNDKWVAPTLTTTTIQGHLSVVTVMSRESRWSNAPEGAIEKGSLRLYTETLLQVGDIVEADAESSVVRQYRVMGMVRANRFMAKMLGTPVRYEFEMSEIPR